MSAAPVKLYVGNYREGIAHIPLLYPFWGVQPKGGRAYIYDAMAKYQYSKEDFALVENIGECDFVLVPHNYRTLMQRKPERMAQIVREAEAAGKPILIDAAGDIEVPVAVPNATVLRISRYRYAMQPNEITIPFAADDLVESFYNGEFVPRKKQECPSVGFAGWANLPPTIRLKTYLKELPITLASMFDPQRAAEHKGLFFREKALAALQKNPRVDANILARKTYSGSSATMTGTFEDTRREFVSNLHDSDYALVVRGDANASVRFYEALSLGRIPLFLDTACVLPLEDKINYRDFCVFVDHRDVAQIGEKLATFHEACSDEQFQDMQRKARKAFTDYLRLDFFSHHLARMLRERVKV